MLYEEERFLMQVRSNVVNVAHSEDLSGLEWARSHAVLPAGIECPEDLPDVFEMRRQLGAATNRWRRLARFDPFFKELDILAPCKMPFQALGKFFASSSTACCMYASASPAESSTKS